MKKIVITLTILTSFAVHALAYDFQSGNLLYTIISTDPPCVSLSGHVDNTNAQGELVIPETVEYESVNYSVTDIGYRAFYQCNLLSGDLVIPNTVTHISLEAFTGCTGFTGSLVIPNNMIELGTDVSMATSWDGVFQGCSGFTHLVLGESVQKIGYSCFFGCSGFTGPLLLPNGILEIWDSAFAGCLGFNGDCKSPGSTPADCKSAGTERDKQHAEILKAERQTHRMEQAAISGRLKRSNQEVRELKDQIKRKEEMNACRKQAESFNDEPICRLILERVSVGQFKSKVDYLEYKSYALSKQQLIDLRVAVDQHFDKFTIRLKKAYPQLTNGDLDYCCLYLLGLTDADIAALMQRAYNTVVERDGKLKKVFGNENPLPVILMGVARQSLSI